MIVIRTTRVTKAIHLKTRPRDVTDAIHVIIEMVFIFFIYFKQIETTQP